MKNSNKLVVILQDRLQNASTADTIIQATTDDQLLLWLASDALDQAEHDLQSAIAYANVPNSITALSQLVLRLQLLAVVILKKHLALLSVVHPQLFVLPLWTTQIAVMWFGTYWLFFGLHLSYWLVMPFIIFNLVTFPFVMRIPDEHVTWVLNRAKELAHSAQESLQVQNDWSAAHTTKPF